MKTPEEEFSSNVWGTLQRIKKEQLGTPKGTPVELRLSSFVGNGIISAHEEAQVLRKLAEWNAIRLQNVNRQDTSWGHAGATIRFFVQQPQFDGQYKKYKEQNTPVERNLDGEKLVPFPQGVTYGQIQKLDRLYQSFFNLSEKGFFLGLADYIKYIVETESLDKEAQKIKEQESQDEETLVRLEETLRVDFEKVARDLFKIINTHRLKFPELDEAIKQYMGVKNKTIQSTEPMTEAVHGALAGIVRALFEKNYRDLIKQYVETGEEGDRILHYRISSRYLDYQRELRRFRELRKKSIWGSWDQLALVYLTVHRPEAEMEELKRVGDFWRQMNFAALVREMQQIIDGEAGHRVEFKVEEYKIAAARVHNFMVGDGSKELEVVKRAREEAVQKLSESILPTVKFSSRSLSGMSSLIEAAQKLMNFDSQKIASIHSLGKTVLEANKKWQEDLTNSAAHLLQPTKMDFNIPAPHNHELELQAKGIALQKEILEELRQQKKSTEIHEHGSLNIPDKQRRKSELQALRERCKLTDMEFKLLKEMFDFQMHSHDHFKQKTGSRALEHLKLTLLKKIKREGLDIDSKRGDSVRRPTYQLIRLIDSSRDS